MRQYVDALTGGDWVAEIGVEVEGVDGGSRIESSRKGSERGFGAAFFGPCPTETQPLHSPPVIIVLWYELHI